VKENKLTRVIEQFGASAQIALREVANFFGYTMKSRRLEIEEWSRRPEVKAAERGLQQLAETLNRKKG